jgi:hypothetical protein
MHEHEIDKRPFPITKAIRKYGLKNFICEEIDYSDNDDDLDYLETKYIEYCDSTHRQKGYNVLPGGQGVGKGGVPDNIRLLLSDLAKKRNEDIEYRIKMSIAHGGERTIYIKKNEEMKMFSTLLEANIFLNNFKDSVTNACQRENGYVSGWRVSYEDLSDFEDIKNKKVFAKEDNREIFEFDSVFDAKEKLGIRYIRSVLNGKWKSANGFYFSYNKEDLESLAIEEKKYFFSERYQCIVEGEKFFAEKNGQIIEFNKTSIAAKELNLRNSNICKVLKGKNNHVNGWRFTYDLKNLEKDIVFFEPKRIFYAKKYKEVIRFDLREKASKELGMSIGAISCALGKGCGKSKDWYFSYNQEDLENLVIETERVFFVKKDGVIKEFSEKSDAVKETGIRKGLINKALNGKIREINGYRFSYKKDKWVEIKSKNKIFWGEKDGEIKEFKTTREAVDGLKINGNCILRVLNKQRNHTQGYRFSYTRSDLESPQEPLFQPHGGGSEYAYA